MDDNDDLMILALAWIFEVLLAMEASEDDLAMTLIIVHFDWLIFYRSFSAAREWVELNEYPVNKASIVS